jgi:hypothetical protein
VGRVASARIGREGDDFDELAEVVNVNTTFRDDFALPLNTSNLPGLTFMIDSVRENRNSSPLDDTNHLLYVHPLCIRWPATFTLVLICCGLV